MLSSQNFSPPLRERNEFRESNLTKVLKIVLKINSTSVLKICGKILWNGIRLSVRGSTVPGAFTRGNWTKDQLRALTWLKYLNYALFFLECTEESGLCLWNFENNAMFEKVWCLLWKIEICLEKYLKIEFLGKSLNFIGNQKFALRKWFLKKTWTLEKSVLRFRFLFWGNGFFWENQEIHWKMIFGIENGFSGKFSRKWEIWENRFPKTWILKFENVKNIGKSWFELGKCFEMSFENSEFWENQFLRKT